MERVHPLKTFYSIIDNGDINNKLNNLPEFPRVIELEITNQCNFNCLMCKTGNDSSERNRGIMSKQIYDNLIEEIKGKDVALKFVGFGESLINTQFIELAKIAKNSGIICHLTTNGSLLTDEIIDELIEIQFDSIKFSFQGVERKGYLLLRQTDDFDLLLSKIEKLFKKRGELEKPYITIGTSITNENKEQVEEFILICKNICDKVEIGVTTLEFMEVDKVKDLRQRKQLTELKKVQTLNKTRYQCCNQVFDAITVRWNGDVSACCADNDGVMVLGNLSNKSIKELWNCSLEQKYRKILSENRYEDLPLCKDCYDYMGYMMKDNKIL